MKTNKIYLLIFCLLLIFNQISLANKPSFNPDVTTWKEVIAPPLTDKVSRVVWHYSVSYSDISWLVFLQDGKPNAKQDHGEKNSNILGKLNFKFNDKKFGTPSDVIRVDDGWLVGFNHGEFGGWAYWLSENGKKSYKIFEGLGVINFFQFSNGKIFATHGLNHLGQSTGYISQFEKTNKNGRWKNKIIKDLPFAPYALTPKNENTVVIVLSDSVVSFNSDLNLESIVSFPSSDNPFDGLYPSSSVFSFDQKKLYVGLRQFVSEIDLKTKKYKLLIPSDEYLNKLPENQEKQIREAYKNQ